MAIFPPASHKCGGFPFTRVMVLRMRKRKAPTVSIGWGLRRTEPIRGTILSIDLQPSMIGVRCRVPLSGRHGHPPQNRDPPESMSGSRMRHHLLYLPPL